MHTSSILRGLAASATALILAATSALAAPRNYVITYSGATLGNSATASGVITIDDALLQNPGFVSGNFFAPGGVATDIALKVSGASLGNGVFKKADFGGYFIFIEVALNLNVNWVGQPQGGGILWGSPNPIAHEFVIARINPQAPTSTSPYVISTGGGEPMKLTSIEPGGYIGDLTVGSPCKNAPGATIGTIYPAAISDEGDLFLRAKLKGLGVVGTNDECILSHDGISANLLVREGDSLGIHGPLLKFGDPVCRDGSLYFSAKLLFASPTNDSVLVAIDTDGTDLRLISREGDFMDFPFPFPATIASIDWVHPADGGKAIYGVQLLNVVTQKKFSAVFDTDNSFYPRLYVGGPVTIDGTEQTLKSISKPTATKPANFQTRVGNGHTISLLVKTVEGKTAITKLSVSGPSF